jgi:UDP-N-acetylglucosamine--N-acetylmuramyl-(pentapeptide) pyrophosphoryl-undecaprenol N-acetylglucosamine transferase
MGKRVIIAGGGTGGHIFPAIAIANALKEKDNTLEILFVGAKGRMEMEKVPQAGYRIEGLDIALPFKLVKSFLQVRTIFKQFKPDVAIGVGGYSSFPVLRFAQARGIKTFIHESNSFAGKSNMMLGRKATRVFTGTDGMEKFFPKEKIIITGNPVRNAISDAAITRSDGMKFFSFKEEKKTILFVGGSLGAKSINEAVYAGLDKLVDAGIQVIWQTGKPYTEKAKEKATGKEGVWTNDFIAKMEYAYAAADVVVARSGAMTVAELCTAEKPVLFVPYPFAAEDHQTVNAMQLVHKNAALMVKDNEVMQKLVFMAIELSFDIDKQAEMKKNIARLAITNADEKIADEVLRLI